MERVFPGNQDVTHLNPSYSLRLTHLSRPRDRAAPGHGPNRERASAARPDLAREQRCSKRTLAEAMDGEGQRPVGARRRTSG